MNVPYLLLAFSYVLGLATGTYVAWTALSTAIARNTHEVMSALGHQPMLAVGAHRASRRWVPRRRTTPLYAQEMNEVGETDPPSRTCKQCDVTVPIDLYIEHLKTHDEKLVTDAERVDGDKLIDPDCLGGKHSSCVGGVCDCGCHDLGGDRGNTAAVFLLAVLLVLMAGFAMHGRAIHPGHWPNAPTNNTRPITDKDNLH